MYLHLVLDSMVSCIKNKQQPCVSLWPACRTCAPTDMNVQMPYVSVIIPVYGEIDGFGQTLTALYEQSYPKERYEVSVIDNGAFSTLNELMKKFPGVSLLKEPMEGSYCARNAGLRHARGDVIAFTDSDCIPHTAWIECGVRALQQSAQIGLVAGKVDVLFASPDKPAATEVYDSLVSFPQRLTIERYHYGATANIFTTQSALQNVGSFDCSLLSGGDCEWGQRVFESGFRQVYCESAVVQHPARKSLSSLMQKSRRVTIGTMRSLANSDGKALSLHSWYYHFFGRPGNLWSQMSVLYSTMGIGMRFRVLSIYYIVKLVQIAERVRVVVLGGKPKR